jgi:hypothetical protein
LVHEGVRAGGRLAPMYATLVATGPPDQRVHHEGNTEDAKREEYVERHRSLPMTNGSPASVKKRIVERMLKSPEEFIRNLLGRSSMEFVPIDAHLVSACQSGGPFLFSSDRVVVWRFRSSLRSVVSRAAALLGNGVTRTALDTIIVLCI